MEDIHTLYLTFTEGWVKSFGDQPIAVMFMKLCVCIYGFDIISCYKTRL